MEFINWDGALLGPGSEWFWSAAQFVVVVITLSGIYRQLRAQGAANAFQRFEALEGRWNGPNLAFARLEFALHLRYGGPMSEAFLSETWLKGRPLADFFADVGDLYERKFLTSDELGAQWGRTFEFYWVLLEPAIKRQRVLEKFPGFYALEELLPPIRANQVKHGAPPLVADEPAMTEYVDRIIATTTQTLRQDRDRLSGVIPGPPNGPDGAIVGEAAAG